MNRITSIVVYALASLLTSSGAAAQSRTVQATVPFDFTVGNKVLPAGTYRITPINSTAIEIRNRDMPVGAISTSVPDLMTNRASDSGKLVFHYYGHEYFLSQILCPSASMNMDLPTSKRERRAWHREASLEDGHKVFLALK